jgi:hypothetical protein
MNNKLVPIVSATCGVLMCLVFVGALVGYQFMDKPTRPASVANKSQALECALAEQEDNAFMKGYKLARNECD